ncbi:hypothetical protein HN51_039019 [Arachis hypogaea]
MAEAEVAPRKRLIIKLRLPCSRTVSSEECKLKDDVDTEKRGPEFIASDSCGEKRKKDQYCSTTEYSCNVVGKSDAEVSTKSSMQEHRNACSRIPRTGSKVLDSKNKTKEEEEHHNSCSRIPRTGSKVLHSKNNKEEEEEHHNACSRIPIIGSMVLHSKNKKEEEEEHHNACSRIPRTGSKVLDSKNTKKEEEMEVVLNEHIMDRYQKIQWILGNNCESVLLKKPIGFEEIESKQHKFSYSRPDEFANDMRLLFSYGLMYPQKDQIHRVARKFNESFEITWKALMEKWSTEKRKRNKIFKRRRTNNKAMHQKF